MASKFWDWFCAGLVFLLVQLAAVRLRMTGWVPNLEFAETLSGLGVVLGLALGYSRFGRWKAAFLAAAYTLVLLPWHLSTAIELEGDWIERVGSLLGRIWFSVHQLSSRQPVEDVLFFAAVMGALYWALGIFCGFQLSRHASAIGAVLPPGIAIIVIQGYDSYVPARAMTLALFLFLSIVLVGRLHFSAGTSDRRQRRVFETGEASIDIRDQLLLASAIVVAVVWAAPAPLPSVDPAERWWDRATAPMRERLSDAVSALESPYGSGRSGDFFAATARLGRNAVLGDEIVFQARSSIGDADSPPRYYWRAWTYDRYTKGEWSNASAHSQEFTPEEAPIVIPFVTDRIEATFTITMRLSRQTVVYAPAEPVWVNRPGHIRSSSASGDANDVAAWSVDPALAAGDRYQVRSWLSNPTVEDLSLAGTAYPEWITSRYLQVPSDLATRLGSLAAEITAGAESPYEQAAAITTYLRREIEYSATLPAAPNDTDPVAWLLFQSKKGFCTYYASAEVLLLRSLGVPARLATGFAEGKLADGSFTVVRSDAHAWPEVYFPRIGWIEFEPTVSQSALTRPSRASRAAQPPGSAGQTPRLPPALQDTGTGAERAEDVFAGGEPLPPGFVDGPLGRGLLILTATLLLISFLWLSRRGRYLERLPQLLSQAYARGDARAPHWLLIWATWAAQAPVERAFQAINLGLIILGEQPPTHATPARRAEALRKMLPSATEDIDTVVGELQAALFSRQAGRAGASWLAGLRILLRAAVQWLRAGRSRWSRRYNRSDFQ